MIRRGGTGGSEVAEAVTEDCTRDWTPGLPVGATARLPRRYP